MRRLLVCIGILIYAVAAPVSADITPYYTEAAFLANIDPLYCLEDFSSYTLGTWSEPSLSLGSNGYAYVITSISGSGLYSANTPCPSPAHGTICA